MVVTVYFDAETGEQAEGLLFQIGEEVERLDHEAVSRLKGIIQSYETRRDQHRGPTRGGE